MRAALMFALAFAPVLLVACGSSTHFPPVTLTVPDDSRLFHGEWTGEASTYGETVEQRAPISMRATATYASPSTYDITGTLAFRGVAYTLRGQGSGRDGATFQPRWSPPPPSGSYIRWSVDVLRGAVVVAKLSSEGEWVRQTDPERTGLLANLDFLEGSDWRVEVQRVPNSARP